MKTKIWKRLLSALLCLLMVCGVVAVGGTISASAATEGLYTYTVSNNEATITGVSSSISGAVTIPSELGGYPVTSIGDSAFYNCGSLTSITIPDSVTSIGSYAFWYCTSLTSINVDKDNPNYASVDGVLFNKALTQLIACPGGKQGAYTIPDSVTSIGYGAFLHCTSLTSITIPDSVTSIGEYAFYDCTSLTIYGYTGSYAETYTLTVTNGTASPAGPYAAGATVTITANAAPSGKVFDKWTGATVASATSATTTLTMPAANTTVTATYKDASNTDPGGDDGKKYISLWGKTTKYESNFWNWLLVIICFGWIWMAF